MKLASYARIFVTGCVLCALSGCVPSEPDEDDALVMSEEEEEMESTPASIPVDDESDALACNGTGHWCLATCSKSGSTLLLIGSKGQLGGVCATPAEKFCHDHNLGYRTKACWGHL